MFWRGVPTCPSILLGPSSPGDVPCPSGGGGANRFRPAWAVLSWSGHIKEHRLRRNTPLIFLGADGGSVPCAPHCSRFLLLLIPNQLAECSKMHIRCGCNNGKPSADTHAPPGEWTPGPLQRVSQSLSVCLAPLLTPPASSPRSPPPLPQRSTTDLGSGFHAQEVPGWDAGVTAPILTMNQNVAREVDEDHSPAARA